MHMTDLKFLRSKENFFVEEKFLAAQFGSAIATFYEN